MLRHNHKYRFNRIIKAARIVVTMLLLGLPLAASAQETGGQLRGTVLDPQGSVVAGAGVTATHVTTSIKYQAATNDEGAFVFPSVRLGQYTVVVEAPGFKRALVQDVKVEVAGIADLNVGLQIGNLSEEITVTSGDAQEVINTTNAEISQVVDEKRMTELPLDGRNPSHLALLQAGVFFRAQS